MQRAQATRNTRKPIPRGWAFFRPRRRLKAPATQTFFERAKIPDGAVPASRTYAHEETRMSHDHEHPHYKDEQPSAPVDWREHGVKVIKGDQLDSNTAQTPGMHRAAAINAARVGAQKIWAGTVTIHPNAKTGAHHHGALESVIYVVRGQARMRWGEHLEFTAEAGPGDFIFVPPYVPHQEINASTDDPLECVLVRSDNEAVVVNLNIDAVEAPEAVFWVDPIHKHPHDH
jgi:uncharacterized RmlC-like cupin family protein